MKRYVRASVVAMVMSGLNVSAGVLDGDEPTSAPRPRPAPVAAAAKAEECATDLTVAGPRQEPVIPRVTVQPAVVDHEINQILDALARGEITSIDVVSSLKTDMNQLQNQLNSPLLRGKMSGIGVDDTMKSFGTQMDKLKKLVNKFQPDELRIENPTIKDRVLALVGRGRNKASEITTSFHSNSSKITEIIEGLSNGRAAIELDNLMLEKEIGRVRDKIAALASQIELWKSREERLRGPLAQLEDQLAKSGGRDAMTSLKVDLLKNEILLPIVQTIVMLEGQSDIETALVLALRAQQNQNKQAIKTGIHLEQTAQEVLPTIVIAAVTAARTGEYQAIQKGTQDLIQSGMNAVASQMATNQERNAKAMKDGPVQQDQIYQFRERVLAIMEREERVKAEVFTALEKARQAREAKVEAQRVRIDAVLSAHKLDALPSPASLEVEKISTEDPKEPWSRAASSVIR